MSDSDPQDLDDYENEEEVEDDQPEGVKRLRAAQKREQKKRETAEADALAARRELAFVRAGIDTETEQGKWFAAKYDGDNTAEAIQAQFSALFGGEGNTTQVEHSTEDTKSTEERSALASNSTADTGEAPQRPVRGVDGEAVRAGMQARNEHGAPMDDAMGVVFNKLVGAGMDGDESVIVRAPKG